MNRAARRHPYFKAKFAAHQANQPSELTQVPRSQWPAQPSDAQVAVEVWRSKKWLVILYVEKNGNLRMTVNRATITKNGKWEAEITWDELMRCKREIGRGEQWAVECFPPDSEVVNVANMRHLFLLDEPPSFGWRKE